MALHAAHNTSSNHCRPMWHTAPVLAHQLYSGSNGASQNGCIMQNGLGAVEQLPCAVKPWSSQNRIMPHSVSALDASGHVLDLACSVGLQVQFSPGTSSTSLIQPTGLDGIPAIDPVPCCPASPCELGLGSVLPCMLDLMCRATACGDP